MHSLPHALTILVAASQVAAVPRVPHVRGRDPDWVPAKRYTGPPSSYVVNQTRADAVKQTFQISWDGYYKYAFPGDSLLPVTDSFENDRNGWGASAIDALSTALIMGKTDVVSQILDFVPEIDFSVSYNDTVVSLFETTIRYLGGLLSGYDLLTGPLATEYGNLTTQADAVLSKAKSLGDNLKFAFDTPTGIPDNNVYLNPARLANSSTNGIATIGTLVIEWTRLSDLTGDATYGELAQKGESYLIDPLNPELGEPFPGLLGSDLGIANGSFIDSMGGWTGGTDSYYEYLIKAYLYDPERFATYKDRWVEAAQSSIKYLASHPTSRPDLTFLAYYFNNSESGIDYYSEHPMKFASGALEATRDDSATGLGDTRGANSITKIDSGHELWEYKGNNTFPFLPRQPLTSRLFFTRLAVACFDGGNFILGGLTLDEPDLVDFGLELTAGCRDTYAQTATGIGPETFQWLGEFSPANATVPAGNESFYERAGFYITNSQYITRPEVIESYYYAYRATGDPKYQEWAWEAYLAINETCRVGSGYSSINDVNQVGGGGFQNFQESFWFAEVLKYSYLIHAEDAAYQVKADGTNEFVYNTEAHPVKIPGGESSSKRRR